MTDGQITGLERRIDTLERTVREGFAAMDKRMTMLEGHMAATDKILEDMGKRMATKGDVYQAVVTVVALLMGMSALVLLALNLGGAFA